MTTAQSPSNPSAPTQRAPAPAPAPAQPPAKPPAKPAPKKPPAKPATPPKPLTAAQKKDKATRDQAFKDAIASAGWTGAVLQSFPELKGIFNSAIAGGWTADRFSQTVRESKWFKARTDTQRQFDVLKINDPKTWQQNVAKSQADIMQQAATIGVPLTPERANAIAQMSMRNGFDSQQLQQAIGAELNYDPSKMYGGQVSAAMSQIKQTASDYMVDVGDSAKATWAKQVAEGLATPDSFKDWAVAQAKAKYSHLSDQLDKGLTMQQIADPYRQNAAKILELDSNSISDSDPLMQQALSYRGTDASGALGLMPQYDFQQQLRKDPRWLQTQNAKIQLTGMAQNIAQMFGKGLG